MPTGGPRLLADIGGTHARFAWQAGADAALQHLRIYPSAAHATLLEALQTYLRDTGLGPPRLAALGMANPVSGDWVQMVNHHWSFSIRDLRARLGVERLEVLNDFEALALAIPALQADELATLKPGHADAAAPRALIGPGTGLGMAGLVCIDGRHRPLPSEGGHSTLCPETAREMAVVQVLQGRFGHVSVERAVSGPGLVWLYEALCELDRAALPPGLTPAEVTERAGAGTAGCSDERAAEALALFFAFLGSAAGNLALTLCARGGVYLAGGIVPRLVAAARQSQLVERFLGKGRMRGLLEQVPLWIVVAHEPPALRGLARVF